MELRNNINLKSLYLSILNATMILRSIGTTLKDRGYKNKEKRHMREKEYKKVLFGTLNNLTNKINQNKLTENEIIKRIAAIAKQFKISIGQSQKAINVILKCHYYLFAKNQKMKKILHCPVDSIILGKLGEKGIKLTDIKIKEYKKIQKLILEKVKKDKLGKTRIDFDFHWDRQHIEDAGV